MREFEPMPLYQELHLPPPPPKKEPERKSGSDRGVVVIDLIGDDDE